MSMYESRPVRAAFSIGESLGIWGINEQPRRSRTRGSENECCQRGALVIRGGKKATGSKRSPPPGDPTEEGRAGFHEGDFGTQSLALKPRSSPRAARSAPLS